MTTEERKYLAELVERILAFHQSKGLGKIRAGKAFWADADKEPLLRTINVIDPDEKFVAAVEHTHYT